MNNLWATILIAVAVFAIAVTGMAIGVIVSNRRLRGSCGGLAGTHNSDGNIACDGCSNPSPTCTGNPDEKSASPDSENASAKQG